MVVIHKVQGYDSFCKFLDKLDAKGQLVHIYFTGSKLPSGESWCSDCVRAQPVIEESLSHADQNSYFVFVEVGDRETWKDPACPFRTDPRTKLLAIPTLVRWKGPQKLVGEQCEKSQLVEMLLADE